MVSVSLPTAATLVPHALNSRSLSNRSSNFTMNTIKSFWVGWGSLIVAGGGAYYFAKVQINADRREKYLQRLAKQQHNDSMLEYDPATRDPQTEQERIDANGQFEANAVYRTKRGDRFS